MRSVFVLLLLLFPSIAFGQVCQQCVPVRQFRAPWLQTFTPVQSRIVLSPVRSMIAPAAPVPQAASIATVDGDLKNRLALRLVLIRQSRKGNADARLILKSPDMFNELYGALQAEHSAGVASGEIQGGFTDFFDWVIEHQEEIAELVKLIISLFG